MATQHRISKTDANGEIGRFLQILTEAKSPSFFNGLPPGIKAFLTPGTLSFVFYKDQIDYMFESVSGANALRIYLAAKTDTSAPSLVIVPCSLNAEESYAQDKFPPPPGDGGGQYPLVFT